MSVLADILLADDELAVRKLLKGVLEGHGYVVRTAERKRRNTIVRSQMSYALALMVLTIVGTMIYLLVHNLR